MTPKEIERAFERLAYSLSRNVERAINQTAREGRLMARQDSSGRWNRRRRARAGYSYSVLRPNPPPQPLGVINVETGQFRNDWAIQPVRRFGSDFVAFVLNRSDRVADLVDASGKPWLSRPIDERVRNRIEPVFQFNVEKAIYRSL